MGAEEACLTMTAEGVRNLVGGTRALMDGRDIGLPNRTRSDGLAAVLKGDVLGLEKIVRACGAAHLRHLLP